MSHRLPVLGLSFLVFTLSLAGTASAQSNSTGNITGDAKAGDTVLIFRPDTGMKREIKMHKDGRYRVRSLPTGNYQVTIKHADGSIGETHGASLRVGSTAFIAADPAPADPAPAQEALPHRP